MTERSRSSALRPAAIACSAGAAALAGWAAVVTLSTPSNQCDNMAGTCLRARQVAAVAAIDVVCVLAAVWCVLVLIRVVRRPPRSATIASLVVIAGLVIALLSVRPVDRLNHRWDGWLAQARVPVS